MDENEPLPGTDQTLAEMRAHEEGPVAHAIAWFDAIRRFENFPGAWALADDNYRLARSQAWIYNNRTHPAVAPHDRDELAAVFSSPACLNEPLWHEFARMELQAYQQAWARWDPDKIAWASRPRPVGVDYEVVVLTEATEVKVYTSPALVKSLPFLMHYVDGGWKVASPGSTEAPIAGWPPSFPSSPIVPA